jgi:hypothetical protein
MICNVRSLKSQLKTRSVLDEIMTSSNEVFNKCGSAMAVEIRKLSIPSRETAENNDTVTHNAAS